MRRWPRLLRRCKLSWRRRKRSWPGRGERIAELEARLRQNPRNSSKPPPGEGLGKPAPRSLRNKSGRKPGGQDGHNGTTLAQVARPDREILHEPGCCIMCGVGLAGRSASGAERRYVFDLQPVRAEVTGHQLIERECGRGYPPRARPRPARKGRCNTGHGPPRSPSNQTEPDILMAKLKHKVPGCLRTVTGARQFRAIRSYLPTAVKHSPGIFDALVSPIEGEPWMPATA